MTPAQHKTAAETGLTRLGNTALIGPTDERLLMYQAHAQLASALGTGAHYVAADALLAAVPADGIADVYTESMAGRQALVHAILADK